MKIPEIIHIQWQINTDAYGSDCGNIEEFDKNYWESLTTDQQEQVIKEFAFDRIDWMYQQVDKPKIKKG